ncbi:MAG: hypothetical protein WBP81_35695 [Solirubrobacteraceae bacterium]
MFAAGAVNGISMLVPSARLEGRVAAQAIVRQMGIAPSAPTWGELQAADTPPPRARPSELGP